MIPIHISNTKDQNQFQTKKKFIFTCESFGKEKSIFVLKLNYYV